jgi:hypothetical protein
VADYQRKGHVIYIVGLHDFHHQLFYSTGLYYLTRGNVLERVENAIDLIDSGVGRGDNKIAGEDVVDLSAFEEKEVPVIEIEEFMV